MLWWARSATPPPSPLCLTLPKADHILTAAASVAASAILFRSIFNDIVPDSVNEYFSSGFRKISGSLSSQITIVIEDYDGLVANQLFQAANTYLGSKLSPTTRRIKVDKPEKDLIVSIDTHQELVDLFQGVKLKWVLVAAPFRQSKRAGKKKKNGGGFERTEIKYFELICHKKHRDMVLRCYLPYIVQRAKAIREEMKTLKLHTVDYNGTDYWGSVNFDHPATFDTLAMDAEMKKKLIEDLDKFVSRKEHYKRVGKAWKRGYLFYGPPGTGKSSLVAAIANYLKFDVYDLDLQEIQCNSDLRRLLIGTANRSILVIEDIDRSLEQADEEKVTLGGLLNFIDGLWSCCGHERIIVFTANRKDQIDPVLLRPGRMDVHLHMSYCTFDGFKTLAHNYLKINEHRGFEEVKELLGKVQATPAEIAEELLRSEDPEGALEGLIKFLGDKEGNIGVLTGERLTSD